MESAATPEPAKSTKPPSKSSRTNAELKQPGSLLAEYGGNRDETLSRPQRASQLLPNLFDVAGMLRSLYLRTGIASCVCFCFSRKIS
jgi:hypothetical protein